MTIHKRIKFGFILLVAIATSLVVWAQVERSPSAEGAQAYIINLQDGDTVQSPVLVQFGLRNMGIAPAGSNIENTGHHHLLINQDIAEVDINLPLPSTDNIVHFGKGQTETMLELEPGEYTLQLLLGDFSHIPHDPIVLSEPVTITVE